MGTDVFLQVTDHLFSMVKILNGEENGHGEGEQACQPHDDLKTKGFIKLYLPHRIFDMEG